MLKDDEIFTQEEIYNIAKGVENKRDRALFIIYYLTGGRASEIVGELRKKDIKFTNDFMLVKTKTLKNRNVDRRILPIPISKEKHLVDLFMEWYDIINRDDVPLFRIGRKRTWQIIRQICGERTHFLRHTRFTHLVTIYDFNDSQLQKFAGWSDTRPASIYTHLKWEDLGKKMLE